MRQGVARFAGGDDDLDIAGTTAYIATQRVGDLVVGGGWIFVEQVRQRHHETGRTIPTLGGNMPVKSRLYGVEDTTLRDAFDGRHFGAFAIRRERDAGQARLAIDQHGTRPAIPHVAAVF